MPFKPTFFPPVKLLVAQCRTKFDTNIDSLFLGNIKCLHLLHWSRKTSRNEHETWNSRGSNSYSIQRGKSRRQVSFLSFYLNVVIDMCLYIYSIPIFYWLRYVNCLYLYIYLGWLLGVKINKINYFSIARAKR